MSLRAGQRLSSVVCECEVIVVRAPTSGDPTELQCGGQPMAERGAPDAAGTSRPDQMSGTALGQRYEDPGSGLEVLCTRSGAGSLSVHGAALQRKAAKALPSSD